MKQIKVLATSFLMIFLLAACSQDNSSSRPPVVDPTNPSSQDPNNPSSCVSVDTDGDGVLDCVDPDIDNDGKLNQIPPVALNFACYRQTIEADCLSASNSVKCTWTDTSKCVTEKSCGIKTTSSTCAATAGCQWDQVNNICNQDDWFSYNRNEWIDNDGDGIGDNADLFPSDPTESLDNDRDSIGNTADPDDDNDGVPDRWDDFSFDNTEMFDIDFDSLGCQSHDPDCDNDGVPNSWDDLFYKAGGFDIDHDLLPAESDGDIDGDNVINEQDLFPYDSTEWVDNDGDKIGNNADPDDDNDAVPDQWDDFSTNRNFYYDSDGDGFANEEDRFPTDPNEWVDNDGDNVGDNGDAFPNNPAEWADTDQDGTGDNADPDIDGDGYLNRIAQPEVLDVACFAQLNESTCLSLGTRCTFTATGRCVPKDSCAETLTQAACNGTQGCTWTGGFCEESDYLPKDKNENLDNDLDGLGDGEDPDNDNDGFPNGWDDFSLRNDIYLDWDNDAVHDWLIPRRPTDYALLFPGQALIKVDPDSDNDGVPDFWDDLAWDPVEYWDIDHDGLGAFVDQDDDNDGVTDLVDAFPTNSLESNDNDRDQIGDTADPDDDNDGAPDFWDTLPNYERGFSDMDNDQVSDQEDQDLDGDTYQNGSETDLVAGTCSQISSQSTCVNTINCQWNPGTSSCKSLGYFNISCVGSDNNFICDYLNSDNIDAFEQDGTEWLDGDLDLIGNNIDPDDDGDGVPDLWDNLAFNKNAWSDIDEDGKPDTYYDNNGILVRDSEVLAVCVTKATQPLCEATAQCQWSGSSCTNIPREDTDIDGDNSDNAADAFPYDNFESVDTDNDTIGNKTDPDDDQDGVPDDFDDMQLDSGYFWDNDSDGLPSAGWDLNGNPTPNMDPFTPNGINNEADVLIALSHNETVSLTSDITITQCIPLGGVSGGPGTELVAAAKGNRKITYNGANGGCVFKPRNDADTYPGVSNITVIIPENKSNVNVIKSDVPIRDVLFTNNVYKLIGPNNKLMDIFLKDIIYFTRSNIELSTSYAMSTTGASLISLRTSSPQPIDTVGFSFIGNIFFWEVSANQTNQLSIIKTENRIRYLSLGYNSINFKTTAGVTLGSPAALFDVDFDGTAGVQEVNKFEFNFNRVNMNTGQFVKLSSSNSTLDEAKIKSGSNQIYGINTMGHPFADKVEGAPNCQAIATESSCLAETACEWDDGVCKFGPQSKSYVLYYDFAKTDTWLAPQRNDYAMFYYPNTTAVAKSPALFDAEVKNQDIGVTYVEGWNDNNMASVYFIGPFQPVRDDDQDTFRNSIDKFPLNQSEWFDNDLDNTGNNADPDDDNDALVDLNEKSACQVYLDQENCENVSICSWNSSVNSCNHKKNVGCLSGTTWNSTNKCCIDNLNICKDGSDPFEPDSDNDGLTDVQEVNGVTVGSNTYKTNPLISDSDNDGDSDSEEIANGTDPNDPLSSKDTDHDGLNDNYEITNFTGPTCITPWLFADTDGDGLSDYDEAIIHNTNPCLSDTDGDGLSDHEEVVTYGSNPIVVDTDGDGLNDGAEVRTYGTNPILADTDGDGAKDGQELIDGTSPTSNTSFKDTDQDNESDYADATPYGVANCDNTTLSQCTNGAFNTNSQLITEFFLQYQSANGCAAVSSQGSCNSQLRGMCKWNTGTSKCESKSLNLYYDITMDRCPSAVASNSLIKIRSATSSRKKIVLPSSILGSASCSFSLPSNKIGWLTIATNTTTGTGGGVDVSNLRFEATDIPYILTSADNLDNPGTPALNENSRGASFNLSKVEFSLSRALGSMALRAYNPSSVTMEKVTVRTALSSSIVPSSAVQSAIEVTNNESSTSSAVSISGSIFECDTKNQLSYLVANNRPYNCLSLQSDSLLFDGNLISLTEATGLNSVEMTSGNNNIYGLNINQTNGSLTLRNSRIYSSAKTIGAVANSTTNTVSSVGVRNGSNDDAIDWSGSTAPSNPQLSGLGTGFSYGTIFANTSSSLSCIATGNQAQIGNAQIHPAYFQSSPARSFWNLINRVSAGDQVQVPGAVGDSICP